MVKIHHNNIEKPQQQHEIKETNKGVSANSPPPPPKGRLSFIYRIRTKCVDLFDWGFLFCFASYCFVLM